MVGHNALAVSAPGKVLLAGGYLVLDRAHTGLVFGLDARIHVVVSDIPTRNGVILSEIEVNSPQFDHAVWNYGYRLSERGAGVEVTQLRIDADLKLNRNPFIETALAYALSYIASVSSPHISAASITILADNDYYSAPAILGNGPKSGDARFQRFGVPIDMANKTGLGSSAALVTAFTAALLSFYLSKDEFDLASETGRHRLHNLSQAAHCAAQGKVGSGFDVASAVYGSMLYRRFSPSILANSVEYGAPGFAPNLRQVVEETGEQGAWDTETVKDAVKVPPGLRLVMCDVSCGSKTPGMVKNVLSWRKSSPQEADAIWAELQQANDSLAAEMVALAKSPSLGLERLRQCFIRIRKGIRLMSAKSQVPIEPPSQTELIDACESLPGVIGGVVPGAGGYDAVALLIEDNLKTVDELKKLLTEREFQHSGKGQGTSKVSMLGVREDMNGVRAEDAHAYKEWL